MSDTNLLTCLQQDLEKVWSAETAVNPEYWTPERPSIGQCAVTALIVQAIFDGRILRYELGVHGTHYVNLVKVDGKQQVVDLTADQFDFDIDYEHTSNEPRSRQELCANDATFRRFRLLSSRLSAFWAEQQAS